MKKEEKKLKIVLVIIVLVLVGFLVCANFFYYASCETQECFDDYMETCSRARFIGSGEMIFEYKVIGKQGGNCIVDVELLQGDLSNQDSLKLVGKEMRCSLPLGVVAAPESDIENCHGLLKEGLQDLIISKLHRYIVQNLGEINEDLIGLG